MKLITWNIQWGRGVDGRVDLARIVRDAKALAPDFDVLCLQEVSDGHDDLAGCDGSDQFAALAALLPGFAALSGTAVESAGPTRRRRFGNMILSRLPVDLVLRHPLPWPADAAVATMPRMALEATVLTPKAGPVRICTTHLEYYSATQRAAQVEALRAMHREAAAQARGTAPSGEGPFRRAARGVPMILTGDFNFRPEAPEHARILEPIDAATPPLVDAWEQLHPRLPHADSIGIHDKQQWPEPAFCCDFVFVSADLAPRLRSIVVDAGTTASDHQPVHVELDA